jgi:hypothetical protein
MRRSPGVTRSRTARINTPSSARGAVPSPDEASILLPWGWCQPPPVACSNETGRAAAQPSTTGCSFPVPRCTSRHRWRHRPGRLPTWPAPGSRLTGLRTLPSPGPVLHAFLRRRRNPCERVPRDGSAAPIACDCPEGSPSRGGRELHNRGERKAAVHTPGCVMCEPP